MIIGQQKGYNTKTRQYRNLEWPILRDIVRHYVKMAEKFGILVTLIDTLVLILTKLRTAKESNCKKYF
jgi:acetyl-CoA carboxylase carboxyl transferase subunit alpha